MQCTFCQCEPSELTQEWIAGHPACSWCSQRFGYNQWPDGTPCEPPDEMLEHIGEVRIDCVAYNKSAPAPVEHYYLNPDDQKHRRLMIGLKHGAGGSGVTSRRGKPVYFVYAYRQVATHYFIEYRKKVRSSDDPQAETEKLRKQAGVAA